MLAAWDKMMQAADTTEANQAYTGRAAYQLNIRIEQVPDPESRITLTAEPGSDWAASSSWSGC